MTISAECRAALAVAANWCRVSARDRKFAFTATLIPINYMVLFLIVVINGGRDPSAVVVQDHGPYARAIVRSLAGTDSFNLHPMDARAALRSYHDGRLVAIITIPPSFDRLLAAGDAATLGLQIDNQEDDFADDIRRGVDGAVNRFAASVAPRRAGVAVSEVDDNRHQVPYVPYVLVSIVVIAIMIGGLFYGGVSAAREYEQGSIVDLLMAPRSRASLVLGMALGTFVVATPGVLLVLAALVLGFGVAPASWAEVLLAVLISLALYAAAGVLLGTITRQRHGLSTLAALVAIPALAISGAFYPSSWSSPVIAALARATPTYYVNGLFQHAFYAVRTTPTSIAVDYGVTSLFLGAAVLAAGVIMTRRAQPA